jgi:indolepyruvate ferredoxin oxidoreductase beta subunit
MDRHDFLLVGVGGQGTLLGSDVIAEAGLRAGYDVKKSEVHGMAQRGGSVVSHVRWAEQVFSPLIGRGEAGLMLAFERLEAIRFASFLRPGATIVVNDHAIPPVAVSVGAAEYPSDEQVRLALHSVTPHVYLVPGVRLAEQLGNVRVSNVVLLGALSRFVDVDAAHWLAAISERVPRHTVEANRAAFLAGRDAVQS